MSDIDNNQTPAPLQREQIPDEQTTDVATLQSYLGLKEHTGCEIKGVALYDPNGINVDVLDYVKIDLSAIAGLQPILVNEIDSDIQLAQLLQTSSLISYSVLKIGGIQMPVLVSRAVSGGGIGSSSSSSSSASSNSLLAGGAAATKFEAKGSQAPIRGNFPITSDQISNLCTGQFKSFAKYASAIAESSAKYGINPLFILADFANQNTNAAYLNPWGISVRNYPLGPNHSQLGQSTGAHGNGPRIFGANEWRIAFDHQTSFVADKHSTYGSADTIAEWALIDAPPGADNDPNDTNAGEGKDVGELYNKLVEAFNQLQAPVV